MPLILSALWVGLLSFTLSCSRSDLWKTTIHESETNSPEGVYENFSGNYSEENNAMGFEHQFRRSGRGTEALEIKNGASVKTLGYTMNFNHLGCCGGGTGSYYYLSLNGKPDLSQEYTFEWTAQTNVHIAYVFKFPQPVRLINVPIEVPKGSPSVQLEVQSDNLLPNEEVFLRVHYSGHAIVVRCGKFDRNSRTIDLDLKGYSDFATEMKVYVVRELNYSRTDGSRTLDAFVSYTAAPVTVPIR